MPSLNVFQDAALVYASTIALNDFGDQATDGLAPAFCRLAYRRSHSAQVDALL